MNAKELAALRLILIVAGHKLGFGYRRTIAEIAEHLRKRIGNPLPRNPHHWKIVRREKETAWLTLFDRLQEG